jgi:hypothetical protein
MLARKERKKPCLQIKLKKKTWNLKRRRSERKKIDLRQMGPKKEELQCLFVNCIEKIIMERHRTWFARNEVYRRTKREEISKKKRRKKFEKNLPVFSCMLKSVCQ